MSNSGARLAKRSLYLADLPGLSWGDVDDGRDVANSAYWLSRVMPRAAANGFLELIVPDGTLLGDFPITVQGLRVVGSRRAILKGLYHPTQVINSLDNEVVKILAADVTIEEFTVDGNKVAKLGTFFDDQANSRKCDGVGIYADNFHVLHPQVQNMIGHGIIVWADAVNAYGVTVAQSGRRYGEILAPHTLEGRWRTHIDIATTTGTDLHQAIDITDPKCVASVDDGVHHPTGQEDGITFHTARKITVKGGHLIGMFIGLNPHSGVDHCSVKGLTIEGAWGYAAGVEDTHYSDFDLIITGGTPPGGNSVGDGIALENGSSHCKIGGMIDGVANGIRITNSVAAANPKPTSNEIVNYDISGCTGRGIYADDLFDDLLIGPGRIEGCTSEAFRDMNASAANGSTTPTRLKIIGPHIVACNVGSQAMVVTTPGTELRAASFFGVTTAVRWRADGGRIDLHAESSEMTNLIQFDNTFKGSSLVSPDCRRISTVGLAATNIFVNPTQVTLLQGPLKFFNATIPDTASSVTITHNMGYTPNVATVSAKADPGADGVWVSSITSTTIVVNRVGTVGALAVTVAAGT